MDTINLWQAAIEIVGTGLFVFAVLYVFARWG